MSLSILTATSSRGVFCSHSLSGLSWSRPSCLARLVWGFRSAVHRLQGTERSLGWLWLHKMHSWWGCGREQPWVPQDLSGGVPRVFGSRDGKVMVGLTESRGDEPVFTVAALDTHCVLLKDSEGAGLADSVRLMWDRAGPPGRDPALWAEVESMVGVEAVRLLVLEFSVTT